jgi:hypothetical protein
MLKKLKDAPGNTVLDIPFCMTGANDMCGHQCPFGFDSNVGQVLRWWHDKRVYGLYAGRLVEEDCKTYDKSPYHEWFHAWKEPRCFQEKEWERFCSYLEEQPKLSAILLYPDMWPGTENKECLQEFERRLGAPIDQGTYFSPLDKPKQFREERILRFQPKCKK